MSESSPERLSIIWSPIARSELRTIDRKIAQDILHCIDRYLGTRAGDVKKLQPPLAGLRLRCGEYRVLFDPLGDEGVEITGVRHRRDAYR